MTAPAPIQNTLTLARLDARRKLLPLEFLLILHGLDSKAGQALVDSGAFHPCFNLSRQRVGRRKMHVWRGVAERFRPGQTIKPTISLTEVLADVLPVFTTAPGAPATIRAVELARRFCLDSGTIATLIRARELIIVGKHNRAFESPRISRASVVAFLERRVL
jgi:hypothetical protein